MDTREGSLSCLGVPGLDRHIILRAGGRLSYLAYSGQESSVCRDNGPSQQTVRALKSSSVSPSLSSPSPSLRSSRLTEDRIIGAGSLH